MRSLLLFPFLVLAACGGASGNPNTDNDTSTAHVLGTRAVPDGTVTVQQTSPSTVRISSDVAGVQSVEVLSGTDYAVAQPFARSTATDGTWSGSAASGTSLLVRLIMTDGSTVETSPGDFVVP